MAVPQLKQLVTGGLSSSTGQVLLDLWQTKTGTVFLLEIRIPLPIIPLIAWNSSSSIIQGWHNRPNSGLSLTLPSKLK
jgi:hypothetical protein